jgi:diguanylate cyclase (GGDEF)-like protein
MKVLVAEDEPVTRRLLHATLTDWGYDVTLACDGLAAWGVLQGDDAPELAILDWVMPGLDGLEVCRRVRTKAGERYAYLLLLSARNCRADLLRGLEAGADDYLTKPFDPAELRARLNTGRRIVQLQNELIAAREAMRCQATRDALTGVYNRAFILETLERELSRARAHGGHVGLLLADLDHFKRINDTRGHLAGDAVLREAAARMMHAMRPYDMVGRYGGEEFLIVLPGCDEHNTRSVGERLRQVLSATPIRHQGQTIPLSLSVGAVVYHARSPAGLKPLLCAADAALYRAKAAGRNRLEMAAPPALDTSTPDLVLNRVE